MNKKQEVTWSSIFGESEGTDIPDEKQFDAKSLVEHVPDVNNISGMIGKNLLKSIEFFESLLKTPARSKQIKHEAEHTLSQMKAIASGDMKLLSLFHGRLFEISLFLYNQPIKQFIQNQIVPSLENLIKNQAKQLKSMHFPILYKSKQLLERNAMHVFECTVLDEVKKKDYQEAVSVLLTLHISIEPHKAKDLYQRIEHEVKMNLAEESEYFLFILKIRLFATEHQTPELIDYNTLLNTSKFKGQYPSINPINMDEMSFSVILDDAQKVDSLLIESKLKENYQNLIIPPLNEIFASAQKKHP